MTHLLVHDVCDALFRITTGENVHNIKILVASTESCN